VADTNSQMGWQLKCGRYKHDYLHTVGLIICDFFGLTEYSHFDEILILLFHFSSLTSFTMISCGVTAEFG
jgi:hypothetical protein